MTSDGQLGLDLFAPPTEAGSREIEWLVGQLRGRDWATAETICKDASLPVTDSSKRRLRALANLSAGRIAGGQKGYKLVESMTREEFGHWRNWMKSQADEMTARILSADRVFYGRRAV